MSNSLLWERTNQLQSEEEIRKTHWKSIEHEHKKSLICITKQPYLGIVEGNGKEKSQEHTVWRTVSRCEKDEYQLKIIRWRMLMGGLCSLARDNRRKEGSKQVDFTSVES